MERFFDIAGSIIRVSGSDDALFTDVGILEAFETEGPDFHRALHCSICEDLAQPEGECVFRDAGRWVFRQDNRRISYIGAVANSWRDAYIRIDRCGSQSCLTVKRAALPDRITSKTVLAGMEVEHLVAQSGGILLHAACICRDGRAIAFTAPSGTGKSTQAALWEQLRGAEIINGDRIVIAPGNGGFEALGIPFSGSSGIRKNRRMPLEAIVYLSQAKQNTIRPLTGVWAFRQVWEGCSLHTWDREDVSRCMETVQQIVARVPIYHLACTPDEGAVAALENARREQVNL